MSNNKGSQGPLEIPGIYITETEYRSSHGSPAGGGGWGSDIWGMPRSSRHAGAAPPLNETKHQLDNEAALSDRQALDTIVEELESVKRNIVLPDYASELDKADHRRAAVDALLNHKRADYQASKERSEAYYGESPLGKGVHDFQRQYIARRAQFPFDSPGHAYNIWATSYKAALLAQTQAKIVQRVAAESERMHAAFREAQRVAHEEALRAAHAQRVAHEEALRIAHEEAYRVAHEEALRVAHAHRMEHEQALHVAHQEALRVAHEKALRVAHKEALRLAEQKVADEKARQLAEQKEAEEKDQLLRARLIQAMEAVQGSSPGIPNPVGIVRTAVSTILNSPAGRAAAVRAVNSLTKAIEGFGRSADELGNDLVRQSTRMLESLRTTFQDYGEFFSGSIPASEVIPQSAPELSQIAAQGGSVDVPGWGTLLGSNTVIGSIELAASDVTAAAPVEVRSATFNERNKTWSVAFPGNPGATLIWTPIAPPIDSSTALPGSPLSEAPYIGKPLSPVEPVISPLPAAPPGLQGLITVFPADSGLPPLFTVFNSPYPGATVRGFYSDRLYNPNKAGGPTLNLKWQDAVITQAGIALVRLHTGRLDYSAANDVMIGRLEKMLAGELAMTDIDKRYYTHEIRELERYRAIGVLDERVPDEVKDEVWNNAHTATLEDFQLKDDWTLFYTAEADAADAEWLSNKY